HGAAASGRGTGSGPGGARGAEVAAPSAQQQRVALAGGGAQPRLELARLFEDALGARLVAGGQDLLGRAVQGEQLHLERLREALLLGEVVDLLEQGPQLRLQVEGDVVWAHGHHPRPHPMSRTSQTRSEEHTSELQSREKLVCRLLLEKKKEN